MTVAMNDLSGIRPATRDFLNSHQRNFIDGRWQDAAGGRALAVVDPATGQTVSHVPDSDGADVDQAVAAARRAFEADGWQRMKPAERGKYIYRIARIMQERAREFAAIETLDGGKPIRESRDIDIPLSAAHFFYYAGWADKLEYAFPGRKPRALGVAGQIIPWNFPMLMAAWKLAPALAASGRYLAIDRDPQALGHYELFRDEVACGTAFATTTTLRVSERTWSP